MKRRAALACLVGLVSIPALALYDPVPDAQLAAVQGEWTGSLIYRDYSESGRLVTLPTRLFVALSSPTALVFHYVFDDGPGKTVFSYETMSFDVVGRRLTWESGTQEKSVSVYDIISSTTEGGTQTIVFQQRIKAGVDRYRMELSARALTLAKDEIDSAGTARFRNRFELRRDTLDACGSTGSREQSQQMSRSPSAHLEAQSQR
jgi:hypothetical protein